MLENNYQNSRSQEFLYQILARIKQKPAIFLGKCAITRLRSFLDGYMGARADLGLPETHEELEFNQFQEWIQSRFNLNSSHSWDSIILFYSEDEKDGLNKFFQLLEEFRTEKIKLEKQVNQKQPQSFKETLVL